MTIPRIALIPAYEPDEALLKLLPQVQAAGFEIIIIDDGSGAEYAPLFEKAKSYAVILTHEINCGKGSALKTGFSYIYLHYKKPCTIVTIDADGQHDINDALAICAIAEAHPDTLVLGSRKLNGRVPVRSQFGNALTRMVYHLATGLKVQDTQTGLRAFSLEHLPLLMDIPGERYEYEMNVLLEYARKKIPIQEHEIETIYINNNASSHFHILRDSFRVYKNILKFSISSFIAFIVDYCLYGILLFITAIFGPSLGISATKGIAVSNICARLVSACVNFTINRKFVFQSDSGIIRAALKYFLLASIILFGNTMLLEFFVSICSIPGMLAKILTELVFFVISWTVQNYIIFRKS